MNVVAVDWSGGNQFPYEQAAANTVVAAAVIRQLLQAMINMGAQLQQIHLIGHSLGAHVSSYVGQELPNLGRISGLGRFHIDIEMYDKRFFVYYESRSSWT
jgi:triacylglycerol esterase/lipase EstA (alpha/beta hydrolase family)